MTIQRVIAVSVCLVGIGSAALLYAGSGDQPAEDRAELEAVTKKVKALEERRVTIAQAAMEGARGSYEAQTITLGELLGAQDRLVEAERANASNASEVAAICLRHRDWSVKLMEKVKLLIESGTGTGLTTYHLETTREYALTAEIELLRAHSASKAK